MGNLESDDYIYGYYNYNDDIRHNDNSKCNDYKYNKSQMFAAFFLIIISFSILI